MTLSKALRDYVDPIEQVVETSSRIIKRYNSRRVKVLPKGTGGAGFDVLVDGQRVAVIDHDNWDESKIREKIDATIAP